jgi:hypothetical protein
MRPPHFTKAGPKPAAPKKAEKGKKTTVPKAPALGPDPVAAAIAQARKEARQAAAKKVMDDAKKEPENFKYIA